MFEEKDSLVIELRPALPRLLWSEWLAPQLKMELVDGQMIKTEKGGEYAKIVLRGEANSVLYLWKEKLRKMIYKGSMIEVKAVGLGEWNPVKFGASTYDRTATNVDFQFDSHEDNNALENRKDMGRTLDSSECKNILDIIDELGESLPKVQAAFELNAHAGKDPAKEDQGKTLRQQQKENLAELNKEGAFEPEFISVHGACKALETLLRIRVKVDELLLDIEGDGLMSVNVHSSTLRQTEAQADATGHRPKLTYFQFLQIYLKLKRLKEEDPNIVSPRLSPRAQQARDDAERRASVVGGSGDGFGHGLGNMAGLSPRTIAALTGGNPDSVRSEASPRIPSPRPQPLQELGQDAPSQTGQGELDKGGVKGSPSVNGSHTRSRSPGSPRLAGGGGHLSSPTRSASARVDHNSITARLESSRQMEDVHSARESQAKALQTTRVQKDLRTRKEDPKLDGLRRKRLARLERDELLRRQLSTMLDLKPRTALDGTVIAPISGLNSPTADNNADAKQPSGHGRPAHPLVPSLPLPSQRTSSSMDRFIDTQAAKRHGALVDIDVKASNSHAAYVYAPNVGPSGMQRRIVEKSSFPAIGLGNVEPRHWFLTLSFWENLARYAIIFEKAERGSAGESQRRMRQRMELSAAVKTAFRKFDLDCFYISGPHDRGSKEEVNEKKEEEKTEREDRIFVSDLPDLMAALKIRTRVYISEAPDLTGESSLDLGTYMHTEVINTGNSEKSKQKEEGWGKRGGAMTAKKAHAKKLAGKDARNGEGEGEGEGEDEEAWCPPPRDGVPTRLGTGEVYWTATAKWWQCRLGEWRLEVDKARASKDEAELRSRGRHKKGPVDALDPRLSVRERKLAMALLAEREEAELEATERARREARRYLGWAEFRAFFEYLLGLAETEARELRTTLGAELWINAKHTALHNATMKFIHDPEYFRAKKAAAKAKEVEEKIRLAQEKEERNRDLFVGPPSAAPEQKEREEESKASPSERGLTIDKRLLSAAAEEEKSEHLRVNQALNEAALEAREELRLASGHEEGKNDSDGEERDKATEKKEEEEHWYDPEATQVPKNKEAKNEEEVEKEEEEDRRRREDPRTRKFFPGESDDNIDRRLREEKAAVEAGIDIAPVVADEGEQARGGKEEPSSPASTLPSNDPSPSASSSASPSAGVKSLSPSARERFKSAQLAKKMALAGSGAKVSPVVSPRIDTKPESKSDEDREAVTPQNGEGDGARGETEGQVDTKTAQSEALETPKGAGKGKVDSLSAAQRHKMRHHVEKEKEADLGGLSSAPLSVQERFELQKNEEERSDKEVRAASSPVSASEQALSGAAATANVTATTPSPVAARERFRRNAARKQELRDSKSKDREQQGEADLSMSSLGSVEAGGDFRSSDARARPISGMADGLNESIESLGESTGSASSTSKVSAAERFKARLKRREAAEHALDSKAKIAEQEALERHRRGSDLMEGALPHHLSAAERHHQQHE